MSSSESQFLPLVFKILLLFLLFSPLHTDVQALLRIHEETTMGDFYHQVTEDIGIEPGQSLHGHIDRVPCLQ